MADFDPIQTDLVLCNHERLRLNGLPMRRAVRLELGIMGDAGEIPGVLLSLLGSEAAQFMLLTAEGARHLAAMFTTLADEADAAGAAIVARHLGGERGQ